MNFICSDWKRNPDSIVVDYKYRRQYRRISNQLLVDLAGLWDKFVAAVRCIEVIICRRCSFVCLFVFWHLWSLPTSVYFHVLHPCLVHIFQNQLFGKCPTNPYYNIVLSVRVWCASEHSLILWPFVPNLIAFIYSYKYTYLCCLFFLYRFIHLVK